jgi:hypothetical protein
MSGQLAMKRNRWFFSPFDTDPQLSIVYGIVRMCEFVPKPLGRKITLLCTYIGIVAGPTAAVAVLITCNISDNERTLQQATVTSKYS